MRRNLAHQMVEVLDIHVLARAIFDEVALDLAGRLLRHLPLIQRLHRRAPGLVAAALDPVTGFAHGTSSMRAASSRDSPSRSRRAPLPRPCSRLYSPPRARAPARAYSP